MIITNYSTTLIKSTAYDPQHTRGQLNTESKAATSSSALASTPQADSLQSTKPLSNEAAALQATTVAGAEAVSNQSSDKKVEQAEQKIAQDLAERDREVKSHERIHASVGGAYASAPTFTYERGPDGQLYAVEGEVRIDTSPIPDDPQATLEKAEVIIRASLSVSEPSPQDRRVAAEARAMAAEARAELAKVKEDNEPSQTESVDSEEESSSLKESQKSDQEQKDKMASSLAEQDAVAEASTEALKEFNDRLNEIQKTLRQVNMKLVDAGVFQKLFPAGSVIDKNI